MIPLSSLRVRVDRNTEIEGTGIDGQKNGDGHCRSGQWRRKSQEVDNDGVDFSELS